MKNYTTQFTMKKDLYRFAKARKYGERIILWENEWYSKFNKEYYSKHNTNQVR